MPRPIIRLVLPLLLLSGLAAPQARAMELVSGAFTGKGVVQASDLAGAPQAGSTLGDSMLADPTLDGPALGDAALSDAGGAVLLDFTPRGGGRPAAPGEVEPPRLRFQLTIDGSQEQRLDALGLSAPSRPSWLAEPAVPQPTLAIGGALEVGGWSLGAGLARTALLGEGADLLTASIGYGSLRASFGYGQTAGGDDRPLDLMLFSTDLAALSWLALESELALGSDGAADPVAVGRFGFKLSF